MKTIEKYLGEKILQKLKTRFMKNIRSDEEMKNKEPCKNRNCTNKIKIYKESYELFDKIIKGMINYDWCDFCKSQLDSKNNKLSQATLE